MFVDGRTTQTSTMESQPTRRVGSARKRQRNQRGRTPKKPKADINQSETTKCKETSRESWIKSSFGSSEGSGNTRLLSGKASQPSEDYPVLSAVSGAGSFIRVDHGAGHHKEQHVFSSAPKHSSLCSNERAESTSPLHDNFDDPDCIFENLDVDFQVYKSTPKKPSPRKIISTLQTSVGNGVKSKKYESQTISNKPFQSLRTCELQEESPSRRTSAVSICDSDVDLFSDSDNIFADFDPDVAVNAVSSNSSCKVRSTKTSSLNTSVRKSDRISVAASRRSSLLRGRLLQTLHRNAQSPLPKASSVAAQVKEAEVEEAMKQMMEIQQLPRHQDIGPFYGLPSQVQELLVKHRRISKLYAWQDECLNLASQQAGRNLIYSLPTSGGKTLVAEILMLKQILCHNKDTLFILPFVSIVQEKVRGMSAFAVELDFLVEEYAASKGQFPPRKRRKKNVAYIATIEKANSLINSLIDEERLSSLGLIVVDELHMLGEGGSRGAILEMTLSKVMHISANTQIVGMSATLSNIKDLEEFLQAMVYTSDFRPVELREFVKLEDTLYEVDASSLCPDDRLKHDRILTNQRSKEMLTMDPEHLSDLVAEVIPDKSCLIFCPTKKNCESVALLLCKLLPQQTTCIKQEERMELLKSLFQDSDGRVCPVLRRTVPCGIAYHHSGLTMDERRAVEEAYLEGTLCLLACTSTLAAGVNLPAKRVIVKSPYVGRDFICRSQYKQMCGRAGRAGLDSSGESVLVVQRKDRHKVLELVSGPYDYCMSSLPYETGKGFLILLLTTIGLKITPSLENVVTFLKRTLCYVQRKTLNIDILSEATKALKHLSDLELIQQRKSKSTDNQHDLEVTNLGRAVYKGNIDLSRCSEVLRDLRAAREALCVTNYLHLLYLITPYDSLTSSRPDWVIYMNEVSRLTPDELKVMTLIGVTETYIVKKASNQRTKKGVNEEGALRFYSTLMLNRLWREESVWSVAERFETPRGQVQQLLTSAAAFSSGLLHFCQELEEFWAYEQLLGDFVKRISHCVSKELLPLIDIPGVKIGRARQLYNTGYESLQKVAHADPLELVKQIEHMPRRTAYQIVSGAKMLLMERVESLQDEVEDMISIPTNLSTSTEVTMEDTLQKYGLDDVF